MDTTWTVNNDMSSTHQDHIGDYGPVEVEEDLSKEDSEIGGQSVEVCEMFSYHQ